MKDPQKVKSQARDAATVARPHAKRTAFAIILVLAALTAHAYIEELDDIAFRTRKLASFLIAGVVVIAGVVAVRAIANGVRSVEDRLGEKRGTPLTFFVGLIGYLIVVLIAFAVLGLRLRGLLLGGAVTGVVLGIAAQQTVGNFFAGIVLLIVRPFKLGDYLVMRSGPLGGEYEGIVTDMGLYYVSLETTSGHVALPNAGVLASAVGPGARAPKEDDEEEQPEETRQDPGPAQGGSQAAP
ncbi:MAG: mechanosensitive ion channel family protein [Actinobacteria bacterium]|nr:mechanosensitive ion channel family protein [Actinomycetota bacterium]